MVYLIDKTNKPYRGNRSRAYDYRELKKSLHSSDPGTRKSAEKAIESIKHESKYVTSMRESLMKAHRQQDTQKIKEIHDYVASHKKYKNE